MKLCGYGEDALTTRLDQVLRELDDETNPQEAVVFYRPSFGRAAKKPSVQFGEFDAIVATTKRLHLLESKCDGAGDVAHVAVVLDDAQVHRHHALKVLLGLWRRHGGGGWSAFVPHARAEFEEETGGRRPPADVSCRFARNCEVILPQLTAKLGSAAGVTDGLLYFRASGAGQRPDVVVDRQGRRLDFRLVHIDYARFGQSGYFALP
jgi:hypothetical protein